MIRKESAQEKRLFFSPRTDFREKISLMGPQRAATAF